jgi:hypothetical protein
MKSDFLRRGPLYGVPVGGANSRIDIRAIQSTAGIGSSSSAFAGLDSSICRRSCTSSLKFQGARACMSFSVGTMGDGGNFRSPAIRARVRALGAAA